MLAQNKKSVKSKILLFGLFKAKYMITVACMSQKRQKITKMA
jgi:hypothetical protein